MWDDLKNTMQRLTRNINRRQLELRKPSGEPVFRLALTWVLLLAFIALWVQMVWLLAITVIVLLVLKYQFVLVRRDGGWGP